MMDYEVQRFTRQCAATGRQLQAGETFYSVLVAEGMQIRRLDYSAESWQGPPPKAIAWWKSQVPGKPNPRLHWAPNDVLLDYFEQLESEPSEWDRRYILALLLLRRRVLRLEDSLQNDQGQEVLLLQCPRRQTQYRVLVVPPNPNRALQIQQDLTALLCSGMGQEKEHPET
ncbi:MAG: hypothetical protein NZ602_17130 [Thermoguttaceae bacterium]|nr:hypothetical protein [Thermoguttaceae bacterium]MDW8039790.1 hypothetical protein [Thermoguttaceae bacterium]